MHVLSGVNKDASDLSLSIWIDTSESTAYSPLVGDAEADVAIVGGGITGITAAYLLAREGRSVVLVDKGRIAMSETGHTTAHIVDSTDADYEDLIKDHGEENARLDSEAIRGSVALIRSLVESLSIDCRFKSVDGFLYAEEEKDREYLERQQEALHRCGIVTEWVKEVPLPFPTIGGLRFPNQNTFHIREYLLPLAAAAVTAGTRVFEHTHVTGVENAEKDGRCTVETERGRIRAAHVILATHVPLGDRGALWAKMHITRTYVVAAAVKPGQITDALFWDTQFPYHYTRLVETSKGLFLVVGGEDRDIGKEENNEERYEALESYCREKFGVTEITHRWSGQINEPADALPFIGESSHGKNVWMSTGYSGTGMTYGTVSAMVLSDLVSGRENRFASLYAPTRKKAGAILENIVTKATAFPKRMIEKVTQLDVEARSVGEVAEGEGKIVAMDGEKYAVSRIDGVVRRIDPTCTHMGCTVAWNGAEKSWDCACHGSRFDIDGGLLNGPAVKELAKK